MAIAENPQGIKVDMSSLAPDMPEELERLSNFHCYAIEKAEDAVIVKKLQKIDGRTGFRIIDSITLSEECILKSDEWIGSAYQALYRSQYIKEQIHGLGLVDEIVGIARNNLSRPKKEALS